MTSSSIKSSQEEVTHHNTIVAVDGNLLENHLLKSVANMAIITILKRTMQTAAGHFLLLSFSFIVMTSSSRFFVYAFQSTNSLQRGNNIHFFPSYRNRSRRLDTSVAYTSTPFDVNVDTNNDLWQLLQELRHNRNAKTEAGEEAEAFQRVIETLYNESRLNIHNLEQEIEVLRQKLDASPFTDDGSCNNSGSSFSFQESFQPTAQEHDDGNRSNTYNYSSGGRTNINVDEISNTLLKAVFVGYQWTEDDRKRLASAHPQDRPF
jgi:hypothetical protein